MIVSTLTSLTSRGALVLRAGSLLAICLVIGCSSSDRTTDDPPKKDAGNSCAALEDECTRNSDCCEGICSSGKCQALCAAEGDSCTVNKDCCEGTCASGKCRPLCSAKGDSCSTNQDCCEGICSDGTCQDPEPECAHLNESCSGTTPCCSGEGSCTAGTCQNTPTKKKVTEVCSENGDCVSNFCGEFTGVQGKMCSEHCATSSGCVADSSVGSVACVGDVDATCLRTCSTSADCAYIGSDWSCGPARTVEGVITGVCGYFYLDIGSACRENRQCASGVCSTWCTKICSSDSDCSVSGAASCLANTAGTNTCFPTCETNSDCTIYGNGLTCQVATTLSGATTQVCSG